MKHNTLASFFVFFVLFAGVARAEHYQVFILGGQSNMYGANSKTDALPPELQRRQEDVLLYSGSELSKLKPGSGRSFGPEVTFGRTIADALPDENFYLIKHSDGGTSLWNEWRLDGGRSYTRLKNVVEIALNELTKAGHTYQIVGILWTQGERDAWNDRTTAQYEADLQAFIADLRSRYGEGLPFFFSRLSVLQTARPIEAVRTAQEYVAAADPNAYLIDTDAMQMQRDNLHFTGKGYMDLGEAFAHAYLNTLTGDEVTGRRRKHTPPDIAERGVIDASQIIVSSSDGSLSFSTFDRNGNPAWHPARTVDGSGLRNGTHTADNHTGWMTERIDPEYAWIQWDLGATYRLEDIHVWNLRTDRSNKVGVRSVDVYFSDQPFPGDPEGRQADHWTRLGEGSIELPQAPEAGTPDNGFDLAKAAGTALPAQGVRYVRFEVNRNWLGKKGATGLAEVRFSAASRVADRPAPAAEKPPKDSTPPRIQFTSPRHEAAGVNPRRNLTLVFDEDVALGRGMVRLRRADGALVQAFDAASPGDGLRLSGGTLTIEPADALDDATTYFVEVAPGAFVDASGNPFAGFSGDDAWRFTTAVPDVTAPEIASLVPTPGTPDFFPADNLVIRFSENIGLGTGAISIRLANGKVVERFDVADPPAGLTYLGDTVTLDPASDLPLGQDLFVEIEPTAIEDNAGNPFPGTDGKRTWAFATPATAKYATIKYVGTQFDIESPEDDPAVGWRNPTPKKPMDIDGDHVLGTDGWRVGYIGNAAKDPPYAQTAKTAPNANAHGRWDNPADPSGKDTTQGVLHDARAGKGETSRTLLKFTITEALPEGTTLRVGLLFDVLGGPNTATYTLRQTFGGTASATTPIHEWTGQGLDVAYFDLTELRPGYVFTITCTTVATPHHPGPFEQVVGVTFDTATARPDEPPSKREATR